MCPTTWRPWEYICVPFFANYIFFFFINSNAICKHGIKFRFASFQTSMFSTTCCFRIIYQLWLGWQTFFAGKGYLASISYRPQTKFAKVMFLHVSVCPRGGIPGKVPPGTRYTPQDHVHPPDQVPPGTRYTPTRTRYAPQGQVPPRLGTHPRTRYPPDLVPPQAGTPPGPGTPPRPGTPHRAGTPPGTRYTPTPQDQVHPQGAAHAGRYG